MAEASRVVIRNNLPNIINEFDSRQLKSLKESIGMRLQKAFLDRIKTGDGSWAPLASMTVEAKGHSHPWYDTSRLEKSIEYETNDAGVRVGVLKHNTYPESGENVASVAMGLEYGTRKIPARPLFRPVFEEQIKDIVADATKDIKARIKRNMI